MTQADDPYRAAKAKLPESERGAGIRGRAYRWEKAVLGLVLLVAVLWFAGITSALLQLLPMMRAGDVSPVAFLGHALLPIGQTLCLALAALLLLFHKRHAGIILGVGVILYMATLVGSQHVYVSGIFVFLAAGWIWWRLRQRHALR